MFRCTSSNLMTDYYISEISLTHFAAWRRCCLIASYCVARGPNFRIENEKTSKFEDQFCCDQSVWKKVSVPSQQGMPSYAYL
jgi:hypothetical protein